VRPDNPRAMDARTLAEKLPQYGAPVSSCDTVGDGIAEAIGRAGKGGVICALGSLYFSGDIRAAYNAVNSE